MHNLLICAAAYSRKIVVELLLRHRVDQMAKAKKGPFKTTREIAEAAGNEWGDAFWQQ